MTKSYEINLDHMGRLPADCPKTFYRVEHWKSGRRDSDWRTGYAAQRRAIELSKIDGFDGRVSTMHLTRG